MKQLYVVSRLNYVIQIGQLNQKSMNQINQNQISKLFELMKMKPKLCSKPVSVLLIILL